MTKDLAPQYQPAEIESRWYSHWEETGLFGARAGAEAQPYSIVLPPPNVTGALHMGHALNHTLQDILIRRARMRGFETLWVPGTDHAGIATQNVVERDLLKDGTSRHDLGREAFVERVWEWKERYGGRITEQMRKLGFSCDWERERFTMDEGLSRAVRTIFVRWFEEELIYKGSRIINWCPRCTTALSDIEVEHRDVDGEIVTFAYPLSDGSGEILVATTRVETMLGDSGIAVHPDDERYSDLVGKTVIHPFFSDRHIPIVADPAVDPEFGTGAVKVTPAHDPTDFDIGERHGLEQINIFDKDAATTELAGDFAGLDRYEARRQVLAALDDKGFVREVKRPYVHPVGHCYRCGTEVEPWLSEQWFVAMKPLAGPAIEAVRDGRIRFVPERPFTKQYLDWMDNLRDWCISRQLWWGHRIPVWYCDDCGATFAALEDPDGCRECASAAIHQDPDVLDTWFSSQLWPFSTLGWPDETADLSYFYPTSVMVTGYDIIYLWVSRMIFSGMYAMGDVPFRQVFINGIVRDFEGKKMSKSMGNIIDPLDIVERYGADALRFSLAFNCVPGSDTNASEERIEGARNFANKLWNAARFIFMSLEGERPSLEGATLATEDRWILSRLDATIDEVDRALDGYQIGDAGHALHSFIWTEFCDWYIELAKLRLRAGGDEGVKAVLVEVLDNVLRLLHPLMPFITQELWVHLRPDERSVMVSAWPAPGGRSDVQAETDIGSVQDAIRALRRLKIDSGIPQGERVEGVVAASGASAAALSAHTDKIVALARLAGLVIASALPERPGPRSVSDEGAEVMLAGGDGARADEHREQLQRKLATLDADIERAGRKLANEDFVAKAPQEVVAKERAKLAALQEARAKVDAQIATLA